jgi:predicted N-acetyltransferase YhbS
MHVRTARPGDDERIGALLVEAFVSTYALKMPEVVVTEARKDDLRKVEHKRETASVLVAEQDQEIIGTVTLLKPGDPSSRAWTPNTGDLRYFAVSPRFQGKGVSLPLLESIVNVARERKLSAICLHVRRGAHGVGRFYQKFGFKRDLRGDSDLPEIYLEAYLLELES